MEKFSEFDKSMKNRNKAYARGRISEKGFKYSMFFATLSLISCLVNYFLVDLNHKKAINSLKKNK